MGVFRLAAIMAVGVALLPSDRDKQIELYDRAATAAKWTVTFCDRNADACTQASGLWDQFVKKAEFGAKLAYDVMHEGDGTSAEGLREAPAATPASRASGTLNAHDLKPEWRGKVSSRSGI